MYQINTPDELPFGNILTWGMPKSLSRELPSSLSHIVPEGDKENSSMGENLLSKSISRGNESFIR